MNSKEKFEHILTWYSLQNVEDINELNSQNEIELMDKVNKLIGEELYKNNNGEKGDGFGTFLGHSFISLSEMINSLEFSKTLIKPKIPSIINPIKYIF